VIGGGLGFPARRANNPSLRSMVAGPIVAPRPGRIATHRSSPMFHAADPCTTPDPRSRHRLRYELSKVEDARTRRDLAERVVTEVMTRAETVEVVRQAVGGPKGRGEGKAKPKAKGKPARLPAEIKHRGSRSRGRTSCAVGS
jgi:hypothetical protein